jgi:hypothetical protein
VGFRTTKVWIADPIVPDDEGWVATEQAKREQTKDRSEEEMGERTVAGKALPFGANEAHFAEHLRR